MNPQNSGESFSVCDACLNFTEVVQIKQEVG